MSNKITIDHIYPQMEELLHKPEILKKPGELIYEYQTSLMEAYKADGKLKPWPMNLNDTDNQEFIRELMGYLVEELFEAQEALEHLIEAAYSNQQTVDNLRELSEESADGMHFMVELFIYSGINHEAIQQYYDALSEERGFNQIGKDFLIQSMQYAGAIFTFEEGNPLSRAAEYRAYNATKCYLKGGSSGISKDRLEYYNKYLLSTIKHLQIARNQLKNKYWKDTNPIVNSELYEGNLMEAWIHWTICLSLLGFTPINLAQNYILKNTINLIRLEQKK